MLENVVVSREAVTDLAPFRLIVEQSSSESKGEPRRGRPKNRAGGAGFSGLKPPSSSSRMRPLVGDVQSSPWRNGPFGVQKTNQFVLSHGVRRLRKTTAGTVPVTRLASGDSGRGSAAPLLDGHAAILVTQSMRAGIQGTKSVATALRFHVHGNPTCVRNGFFSTSCMEGQ
jgi:hypothetical protein